MGRIARISCGYSREIIRMLLALAILIFCGLAVGGEYLARGRRLGFRQSILCPSFIKKFFIELVAVIVLFSAINYDFFAILNMSAYKLLVFFGISLCAVTISLCVLALEKGREESKPWWVALVCIICVLSSEIFIFNSRAIQSYEYERVDILSDANISASEKTGNYSYHLEKGTTAKFELTDFSAEIKNIFIDLTLKDKKGEEIPYTVKIEATDKANELYITSMPTRKIYSGTTLEYIPMQLRGESDKLRITVTPDSSVEADLTISSLAINTPRPFEFNPGRVLLVLAVVFLLYLISPASHIYKKKLLISKWPFSTTALVIILEILVIFLIISSSSHYLGLLAKHQAQYQQLSESFLNGHLYLEQEVPEWLLEMENPYDYALRRAQGKTYYWDAALYGEHYYVYFGVVPCLLTYLPYFVLTGEHLSNDISLFMFAILFIIGCFSFVKQLIKRFFPESGISYVSYLIISLLLVNGSGLLFMASYADMYSVPIMAALAFTVCGLALWLAALNNKRWRVFKLALGSLCMALVAGCRPNLLLFSALAIPFFVGEVIESFKEKRHFEKASVANALAFAIPYIIVAAGIMWYNYARFGSPFDFGSNYNLTTNDMTSRGFMWERMLPATYSYLFQLPKMTAAFPFIRYADFDTTYMGVTIRESTYGGIFAYSPMLLLIFCIPWVKDILKKHRVYAATLILVAIGIVTALLDAQFAGILQRYFADFSLMLYMAAAFILIALINHFKEEKHRYFIRAGLMVCVVAMAVYQGALVMRTHDITGVLPYLFWY